MWRISACLGVGHDGGCHNALCIADRLGVSRDCGAIDGRGIMQRFSILLTTLYQTI